MKHTCFVLATALLFACQSTTQKEEKDHSAIKHTVSEAVSFDSTYAKSLGADDYGMHKYVLVLLKKGPTRDQDSLETARIQRAHLDNMNTWAEDGFLVVAGPTYNHDSSMQGLFVFALEEVEEVEALVANDPAIQSGRLVMECYPWYSSAALMDVNRIHGLISKNEI